MTQRTRPRLTADVLDVCISQLYGARSPRVMSVTMQTGYSRSVIRADLTAHDDYVDCTIHDEDASASDLAHQIQVEWQTIGEEARRAWFICGGCRKRRRTLYFVKLGFRPVELVCRRCGGFRYPSQDVDPVERLASEISGIHARLGSQVTADPYYIRRAPWPARPKGMHMRTYRGLLADLAANHEKMEEAVLTRAQRLIEQNVRWAARTLGRFGEP